MSKTITVTVKIECDECSDAVEGDVLHEPFEDGEIVHTDEPHLHASVGHDAGKPHVEGTPEDEDDYYAPSGAAYEHTNVRQDPRLGRVYDSP